jgi:hypothetical protein
MLMGHQHGRPAIPAGQQNTRACAGRCKAAVRVMGTSTGLVLLRVVSFPINAVLVVLIPHFRKVARMHRRIRRAARRAGARDGQVVADYSGSGVFGEGPHWRRITVIQRGEADHLLQAQVDRAVGAGYQREAATAIDGGYKFPARGRLPGLAITVLPAGARLIDGPYWLASRPLGRPPELVWSPDGGMAGPGWARRLGSGAPLRYTSLSLPVVPAGSTGMRIGFQIDRGGG